MSEALQALESLQKLIAIALELEQRIANRVGGNRSTEGNASATSHTARPRASCARSDGY